VSNTNGIEEMVSLNGFKRFEAEGDSLEGIWMGVSQEEGVKPDGKEFLAQGMIVTEEEGFVRFNMTAQMTGTLPYVPLGTSLRIEYTGQVKASQGNVKTFSISIPKKVQQAVALNMIRRDVQTTQLQVGGETLTANLVTGEVL